MLTDVSDNSIGGEKQFIE